MSIVRSMLSLPWDWNPGITMVVIPNTRSYSSFMHRLCVLVAVSYCS